MRRRHEESQALARTRDVDSEARRTLHSVMRGSSRASRLGTHRACPSEMAGASPAMTSRGGWIPAYAGMENVSFVWQATKKAFPSEGAGYFPWCGFAAAV